MENKRLFLAIALSVAIFLGWNWLALKMGWITPAPPVAVTQTAPAANATAGAQPEGSFAAPQKVAPEFVPTQGQEVRVDTPLYTAVFHSQGGVLRKFSIKGYQRNLYSPETVTLVNGGAADKTPMALMLAGYNTATQGQWSFDGSDVHLEPGKTGTLRFVGLVDGMRVTREFTFSGDTYVIAEKTEVQSDANRELRPAFTMAAAPLTEELPPSPVTRVWDNVMHFMFGREKSKPAESQYNTTRVAWLQDGSFHEEGSLSTLDEGKKVQGLVAWGAVMNNYFVAAVSMKPTKETALFSRHGNGVFQVSLGNPELTVAPGQPQILEADYYLGPKSTSALAAAPNDLGKTLHYGMFTIIAKPLVALLQFLYGYVGNYGVAIILMTVLIKLLFWPLSQKSYKSMEEMKRLQPEIVKIRERYADDKEAMNKEIMQLYRSHKVNPAGGCLPIVVQIPVFFGLYQALLNSIELRHAVFIEYLPFTTLPWLNDLSAPDPYMITPLIMGATMFLQQKMAPPAGDPTQQKIMLFMPLIFTVLFLGFPSGLVVYWLVNNVISIFQQWTQRRKTTAQPK